MYEYNTSGFGFVHAVLDVVFYLSVYVWFLAIHSTESSSVLLPRSLFVYHMQVNFDIASLSHNERF